MHSFRLWSRAVRGVQWTFALAVVLILLDLANIAWQAIAASELMTALEDHLLHLYSFRSVPHSIESRPWCALLLYVKPSSYEWMSRVDRVGVYTDYESAPVSITVNEHYRSGPMVLKKEYWEPLWRQPELNYVRLDAREMPRESLRVLQEHPTLESLMLVNTSLRDEDCALWATLPKLKRLALSSPYLTDRCLEHFKDLPLEELWLKSPGLTGKALEVMASMPGPDGHGLRYLGLLEATVEDEELECLQGHQLLGLELAHTQITDHGLASLDKLSNPNEIDVGCNERITREAMVKLRDYWLRRKGGRNICTVDMLDRYCTCFGRRPFKMRP